MGSSWQDRHLKLVTYRPERFAAVKQQWFLPMYTLYTPLCCLTGCVPLLLLAVVTPLLALITQAPQQTVLVSGCRQLHPPVYTR
jgi:hypothetical protein